MPTKQERLAQFRQTLGSLIDNDDLPLATIGAIADAIDGPAPTPQQPSVTAAASDSEPVEPAQPVERPSIAAITEANKRTTVRRSTPAAPALMVTARQQIPTGEPDIASAMLAALQTGRLRAGKDQQVLIASIKWDYPTERQLTTDDAAITSEQLTAALTPSPQAPPPTPANNQPQQRKSLIAYGGICQPIGVDYAIPTFASEARPVRDGLPAFQATRGGINYNTPPLLTDAQQGSSIWTVAMDEAGTATKPCLTLACQPMQTVLVHGVPVCVTMGNMQQRYNPELVAAWLNAVNAQAARMAELSLLAAIAAQSTAVTTTAGVLGAARELLPLIDQAAAAIRYRNRQTRQAPTLRVILFEWVQDLLRADIARELAHDNDTPTADALALAEARLQSWFQSRNISPIWAMDDPANPFATQAAGALTAWPTSTTFTIFAEGTWVFLDGGRLDVGLLRDSALNSTNQVAMFAESFEAVAFRGVESMQVTAALAPTGLSAGSIDTSTLP